MLLNLFRFIPGVGYTNSHCILKTKILLSIKLCCELSISYLEDMLRSQLCRMSGSCFRKWLFGTEKFSWLSRNDHLEGKTYSYARFGALVRAKIGGWASMAGSGYNTLCDGLR